ncbi:unnamed protein product [Brassicogethes aeneus]|uniref:Nucleic-acid-binding protein from transposon X-element n=1 Tax=Brassicogethes aeneus TaxID=1431903 RepID=A0A9P0FQJ5_BRAAE|nr:unnamed protein product [Brassicogethes aeneus]
MDGMGIDYQSSDSNQDLEKLYSEIITSSSNSSFSDIKTGGNSVKTKLVTWKPVKLYRNQKNNRAKPKPRSNEANKNGCDKKSSLDSIEEFYCLYLTSTQAHHMVTVDKLEDGIKGILKGQYKFKPANYGIIAVFTDKHDFDKVLQLDLRNMFGVPVQVGNLCNNDKRYRHHVTFKNVPWCISNQELSGALKQQGIHFGKISRSKNNVRVEVFNSCHLERLLQEGLNFYNCVTFSALTEGMNDHYNNEIIQCYKCQGFWHTANHCRHSARCVRCGGNHEVQACPRPKNNPVCCNCGGPHHAAYKMCPTKLQLVNSVKVAFSLSNKPNIPSFGC